MYNSKFHFGYSKSERNGIFVLLLLVFCVQVIYLALDKLIPYVNAEDEKLSYYQSLLDSVNNKQLKPDYKLTPFNPNYMTDYKGYMLGLSAEQIDRLWLFRENGGVLYSLKQFQDITQVSDSALSTYSSYLKFPRKWKHVKSKAKNVKIPVVKKDINTASYDQLIAIKGIGDYRAKAILKLRDQLGGVTFLYQLKEVWKFPEEVYNEIAINFEVKELPKIKKLNVNLATVQELKSIFYIDYKLAKSIVDYRLEFAEITRLAELKKIDDFPLEKYELISLYLRVN